MVKIPKEVEKMYLDGCSVKEAAAAFGINYSTLRRRFVKLGIMRSHADAMALAAKRGRLGTVLKLNPRPISKELRKKLVKAQREAYAKTAKGKALMANGYIRITRGKNRGKNEHVIIIEESIGREIAKGEHVHHIDGDRSNNKLENLLLMTNSEHIKLHFKQNPPVRDERGRILYMQKKEKKCQHRSTSA
jgi:hypothetical protein